MSLAIAPQQNIDPHWYHVSDLDDLPSPGLLVFREMLDYNLAKMIEIAGSVDRLRPHCKTHKMADVTRVQLDLNLTRHKCATLAEAEMLCREKVPDILIAYQMVGPNIGRLIELIGSYPDSKISVLVDAPGPLLALASAAQQAGHQVDVLVDLDTGMHRTGISPDEQAVELYQLIADTPAVNPGGLHWYDGHQRHANRRQRETAVLAEWRKCEMLVERLEQRGLPMPKVVAAGTGSFPILAEQSMPNLELSPGTVVFFDAGYTEEFPDLPFRPAIGLVTRVVSDRYAGHLTLDVGHKAVAADKPAGKRVYLPELPDAVEVGHTEEHLVIRTERADEFSTGDAFVALPRHVCPTCALHGHAHVIIGGQVRDRWPVSARHRL